MATITKFATGSPASHVSQTRTVSVARTDTTAALLMILPKAAVIESITLQADTASDAATTATVSIGTSTTATEWVNGQDVKTAAGIITPAIATGVLYSKLTHDTAVYAKYAETGTASTTGGPWYITVKYYLTGPGQTI